MSQDISSTAPQAGVVTFEVPLFVSVDLDQDTEFRRFTAAERVDAISALVSGLSKLYSPGGNVTVTAGLATQVERVPV